MAGNRSVALFLLLLAFLLLITAPLVLIFAYRGFSAAATAGLFIIPVLMVFLAVVIVAVKKRGMAIPSAAVAKPVKREQVGSSRLLSPAEAGLEPVRYPWEGMFGSAAGEHNELRKEKRRHVSGPHPVNFKAAVIVVIVVVIVVLVLLLANAAKKPGSVADSNKTAVVNITPADTPSAAAKGVVDSAKGVGIKIRSRLMGVAGSVKSRMSKVPAAVWQVIAVAAVSFLFTVAVFYSAKSGQLAGVSKWFWGWLGWLLGIFSYARKHKLRVLVWAVAAAVACAVIAVVVFRKWVIAKLPSTSGLPGVAVNALLAVRDFVSVYRLYIIIGVFALLAVIGILVALEKRGRG